MKKIIIAGPRVFRDYDGEFHPEIAPKYYAGNNFTIVMPHIVRQLPLGYDFIVVQGQAYGVDLHAKFTAESLGILHKDMPADWNKYGKKAGYIRNMEMAEEIGPDGKVFVILAKGFENKGSSMMIQIAKDRGLELETVELDPYIYPDGNI